MKLKLSKKSLKFAAMSLLASYSFASNYADEADGSPKVNWTKATYDRYIHQDNRHQRDADFIEGRAEFAQRDASKVKLMLSNLKISYRFDFVTAPLGSDAPPPTRKVLFWSELNDPFEVEAVVIKMLSSDLFFNIRSDTVPYQTAGDSELAFINLERKQLFQDPSQPSPLNVAKDFQTFLISYFAHFGLDAAIEVRNANARDYHFVFSVKFIRNIIYPGSQQWEELLIRIIVCPTMGDLDGESRKAPALIVGLQMAGKHAAGVRKSPPPPMKFQKADDSALEVANEKMLSSMAYYFGGIVEDSSDSDEQTDKYPKLKKTENRGKK